MKCQYLALGAALAAAMTLAACGGDDDDPAEETPAAVVTPEPDPPAMDAAEGTPAAGFELADIVGVWAETPGQCGTDDELIIAPDAFLVGAEACIVTGVDAAEIGLAIQLLCPVADAAPGTTTWTVAAFGDTPFTEIAITDGDVTTAFSTCAAAE